MTRPYSLDLRERVVAAVEKEGLSRNRAAARFGVAVSTAVHWCGASSVAVMMSLPSRRSLLMNE